METSPLSTATASRCTVAHDSKSSATVVTRPCKPYRAAMTEISTVDTDKWRAFVREQLEERGLDARTAAQKEGGPLPADPVTIRRWLNPHPDKQQTPTVDTVLKVAAAFGYPAIRALIRVGIIPAAEAGVVGLAPTPPRMHRLARRVNDLLENARIPEVHRTYLARLVEAAVDFWSSQMRLPAPPVEPSARERAAGATVRRAR